MSRLRGLAAAPDDFNVDLFAMFIFTGTHSSVLCAMPWLRATRARYVSKLSQLFYLAMSRLNAHDSLRHDLLCDVRYPSESVILLAAVDDCFHFSHFTPSRALFSPLSMSEMRRSSDTGATLSSSLCLL